MPSRYRIHNILGSIRQTSRSGRHPDPADIQIRQTSGNLDSNRGSHVGLAEFVSSESSSVVVIYFDVDISELLSEQL